MKTELGQHYVNWSNRFAQLSMREKIIILFATMLIVIFVGGLVLIEPSWQKLHKDKLEHLAIQKRLAGLDRQIVQLQDKLTQDPDLELNKRVKRLSLENKRLDKRLSALTSDLVPANKMAELLESILSESSTLSLVSLDSLPAKLLHAGDNGHSQQPLGLYQHGVKLTLEGQYFTIQQFLDALEQSKWQFYWKRFDYQVSEYPLATLELELYTLSRSEAFIGA